MLSNQPQTKADPSDLWQSISHLVALYNQTPPLIPASRDSALPLSFSQERLWWLSQLNPSSSAYHIPLAFHLVGSLDELALQQSLQFIVNRHEALRSRILVKDNHAMQVVADVASDAAALELQKVEIQSLADVEALTGQDDKIEQLLHDTIQRPFDLAVDLPIRAMLLQRDKKDYIFLLVIHHIAFDGWSEGIFCRELTETYAALSEGRQPDFSLLPVNYADFSVWQKQWLRDDIQAALLKYWKARMNGRLATPELPVQPAASLLLDSRTDKLSACQTLSLGSELSQTLKQFSKRQGVTLFVTLLTAFKGLLYQYCQQESLMVCTPVACRNRNELKPLIGYFVNLMLLQSDLSGEPSFESLLQQVRQVVAGAFAHQDLPVQQLISEFKGVKADVSRVMFVLQNAPSHSLTLSGMTVTPWKVGGEMADFDIFLSVTDEGESLTASLKYNAGLFEKGFIQTLLQRFRHLLSNGSAHPHRSLSALLPIEDAERQRLKSQQQNRGQLALIKKRSKPTEQPTDQLTDQPRNEVEKALVEIWEALLGISPSLSDNFFELGGQSLIAVQLLSEIEERFGKKLPLNILLSSATVAQLASVIQKAEASSRWPVLVQLHAGAKEGAENTMHPPLFCIHGIGGAIIFYREIARHLKQEIPVYALQSLGLDGMQMPLERVEDMAERYIEEIRRVQPCGPYYITGYSFGGLIAFEIAQRLKQAGETMAFVGLLDTLTPDLAGSQPSLWAFASTHLTNLWQQESGKRWKYILGRLKRIRRQKKVQNREYEEELKRHNPDVEYYKVLGPNYRAADVYVAKPYDGNVTVFRAQKQSPRGARFPALGWDTYAQTVTVHAVPGSHFSMIRDPNSKVLGDLINSCVTTSRSECAQI